MLTAALKYAGEGLAVFPCKPERKEPLIKEWQKRATTDKDTITAWWTKYPNANIGIHTGKSNLIVIDLDRDTNGKDGIAEWHELRIDEESPTRIVDTPKGGQHRYYRRGAAGGVFAPQTDWKPGIDIRAGNSYVLAPPSHTAAALPKTAEGPYVLTDPDQATIADLPLRLQILIVATPPPRKDTKRNIAQYRKQLARLCQARCDGRQDWIRVGMALTELGDAGLKLWEEWSKQSDKHEEGDCAKEWDTFGPGDDNLTLASLAYWAKEDDPEGEKKSRGRPSALKLTTDEYMALYRSWGLDMRQNLCNDDIEVNGKRRTDIMEDVIIAKVRDYGILTKFSIVAKHAKEAMSTMAMMNAYHPVKQYLEAQTWDGEDHIAKLASYFTDAEGYENSFERWLRHWGPAAVARVYEQFQCPMLVLVAPQNEGKSYFVEWLCPLEQYFYAGPINPDAKDNKLRIISVWLWEVSELESTTKRANLEALKAFLTYTQLRERVVYGRRDIIKPILASFIGTVNDSGAGFLIDRTGNRRFLISSLESINKEYSKDIDKHQLWAQFRALYEGGGWMLTDGELAERDKQNLDFMTEDPIELRLDKCVDVTGNPEDVVPSWRVMERLREEGCRERDNPLAQAIARILKSRGVPKATKKAIGGRRQKAYSGIKLRSPLEFYDGPKR